MPNKELYDIAEFIMAKHRNGETADVTLRFRGEFIRFEEWDTIGSGAIINVVSISGIVGNAGQTNYSAAKGATTDPSNYFDYKTQKDEYYTNNLKSHEID